MRRLKYILRAMLKRIVITFRFNRLLYCMGKGFKSKKIETSFQDAKDALEEFSPCPKGASITQNTVETPRYDLQIVIPVYNVEKYIRECINSILQQNTKYSYKVVLINDGSTDGTTDILKEYENNEKLEIIHQENRGFAGARNRGLKNIQAKYVAFVDSDDMLVQGAIESLLNAAFEEDADIVEGGFYRLTDKLIKGYQHKKKKTVHPQRDLKGYPCGKVFKSELFSRVQFSENYWFEDSIGRFLVHPQAVKGVVIPQIVYIYRMNMSSISHTMGTKKKCVDTYWVTELMLQEQQILQIENSTINFEEFLKQVVTNYKRAIKMPIHVQQSMFVCTKRLLETYFPSYTSKTFQPLICAFKNNDFGKYAYFCQLFIL